MIFEERFWAKVQKTDHGCWNWTAYKTKLGYGRIVFNGQVRYAHRMSYLLLRGEVPKGMELDHLCRNRSCVNPNHLEVVSHTENVRRGLGNRYKEWTHCIHGHEFNEKNTYIKPDSGNRACKICKALRCIEYRKVGLRC